MEGLPWAQQPRQCSSWLNVQLANTNTASAQSTMVRGEASGWKSQDGARREGKKSHWMFYNNGTFPSTLRRKTCVYRGYLRASRDTSAKDN